MNGTGCISNAGEDGRHAIPLSPALSPEVWGKGAPFSACGAGVKQPRAGVPRRIVQHVLISEPENVHTEPEENAVTCLIVIEANVMHVAVHFHG